MSRKSELYLYKRDPRGPKRDTSSEINRFELERYVESQIVEKEMDIDKILTSKDFSRDEIRIVKLVMAKLALLSGNKGVGERLIREVEETPDKGTDVFFYLEQLKKNKTLYSEKARHNPEPIKIKQKTKETN